MCPTHSVTKDISRRGSSTRVRCSSDWETGGWLDTGGEGAAGSEFGKDFWGKIEGSLGLGPYVIGSRHCKEASRCQIRAHSFKGGLGPASTEQTSPTCIHANRKRRPLLTTVVRVLLGSGDA